MRDMLWIVIPIAAVVYIFLHPEVLNQLTYWLQSFSHRGLDFTTDDNTQSEHQFLVIAVMGGFVLLMIWGSFHP